MQIGGVRAFVHVDGAAHKKSIVEQGVVVREAHGAGDIGESRDDENFKSLLPQHIVHERGQCRLEPSGMYALRKLFLWSVPTGSVFDTSTGAFRERLRNISEAPQIHLRSKRKDDSQKHSSTIGMEKRVDLLEKLNSIDQQDMQRQGAESIRIGAASTGLAR
jgi:hypothetical protein